MNSLHPSLTVVGARGETAFSPWSYCLDHLFSIVKKLDLQDEDCAALAKTIAYEKITNPIMKLFPQDVSTIKYDLGSTIEAVTMYSGLFGDKDVINNATKAVRESETVGVNLRKGYYNTAAAFGDEAIYSKILSQYQAEPHANEKRRLLYALTSALDPSLISQTLYLSVSSLVQSEVSVDEDHSGNHNDLYAIEFTVICLGCQGDM